MLQNLLIIMTLLVTILFLQMNHPLAMGLMLLIQTLLICLMTGLMNETYWFSYILFLVFLGGMLILFIYVTSLTSNETFTMSNKTSLIMVILFISLMSINYMYDNSISNMLFSTHMSFNYENSNLIKLFNYPTNLISILLMNYLLITLIAVVKITNIFYGPLRQMFN